MIIDIITYAVDEQHVLKIIVILFYCRRDGAILSAAHAAR